MMRTEKQRKLGLRLTALLLSLLAVFFAVSCAGGGDETGTESGTSGQAPQESDSGTAEPNDPNGEILEWDKEFYMELDLVNTYSKLVYEKSLQVAFIGGSVTSGAFSSTAAKCWAGLTGAWLREQFPQATILTKNAGWGGTGVKPGVYRLEEDALSCKPDLVFVEFAINDYYDGTSVADIKSCAESIIRKLYAYDPTTEVVFVLISEHTASANSAHRAAYMEVAEAYHVPVVDISTALTEHLSKNNLPWEELFGDVVHPNDKGHAFYAEQVKAVLKTCFDRDADAIFSKTVYHRPLPSASVGTHDLTRAQLSLAKAIGLGSSQGFSLVSDSACRYRQYLQGGTGAELTVNFSGTDIGILFWKTASGGKIAYAIDGGAEQTLNVNGSNDDGWRMLFEKLENGSHTLTLRVTEGQFNLQALMVNGALQ